MARRCVILGGGGHARVVLEALRASKAAIAIGIVDPALKGAVEGLKVLGGDEVLKTLPKGTLFVVGLGAVRDNKPRRVLFEKALARGLKPLSVVHPSALVSPSAVLESGCVILPRAVVNAGARVGANAIINTGAIVEHDCVVLAHAHVATGAILCGRVRVEALAHIGAGAVVRQGVTVGAAAVVGAGAVVVKDVAAASLVVGAPARPVV
ncbi:MAG TPA: transferase [Elusimicrobia bacterium]|nr:MAG: hypothetical protein A2040_03535 [Rhodocyclales bacterium GWA2_65_19]HAZ07888.1 transferase [Elusimicrobiota bacterium]